MEDRELEEKKQEVLRKANAARNSPGQDEDIVGVTDSSATETTSSSEGETTLDTATEATTDRE